MKKAFLVIFVIILVLGIGGCQRLQKNDLEEDLNKPDVEQDEEGEISDAVIEYDGLIVRDEDDYVLISEGEEIALIEFSGIENYLDSKVKVFGQNKYDGLEVQKIQIWKQGRLLSVVGNLYLTLDKGDHLLLQGSVVPELMEKYVGREAKLLGQFADKGAYKFKILEYYIQGVKTDVYQEYKNDKFGFKLRYPADWEVIEDQIDVGHEAYNITFKKVETEINLILQKEIPRPALEDDDIEKQLLPSGLAVQLYHDTEDRDGAEVDRVIFALPESDYDFYIAGFGNVFNQVYQSIELLGDRG